MTISELEQKTIKLHPNLDKNDIKTAIMYVYKLNTYTDYQMAMNKQINQSIKYKTIINRLLKNEPIQYILNEAFFYYRTFFVNKSVLIPRPETEELVHTFLHENKNEVLTVVDIGTGSGIIALTIKDHSEHTVYGSDISKRALRIANKNNINNNVIFKHGDLLNPFIKEGIVVDAVVANLPYIKREEMLEDKVKNFEPARALYLPKVNIFNRLFSQTKLLHYGKNGVSLYLEYGTKQTEELVILARKHFGNNVKIDVVKDMQGKERFLIIRGIYANKNL